LADGKNGLAGLEVQSLDALHAGINWFHEACLLERNTIWNSDCTVLNNPVHDPYILGKAAAGRLKASGAADLFVRTALRKRLVLAIETLPARDVMEDYDPVSCSELANAQPHVCDYARRLVAEDPGRRMGACGNFLEVRSANSAGVDANQHLPGPNLRYRDGFHAHVIDPAIHSGQHGPWDGFWLLFDG